MSGTAKLLFGLALGVAMLAPVAANAQTLQTLSVLPSGTNRNNPAPAGAEPSGSVIREGANLYVLTPSGANGTQSPYPCGFSNGCGSVVRINIATGKLTTLYTFCSQPNCTDGAHPVAALVYRNGAYYGTTEVGGSGNPGAGTVFKLTPPPKGQKTWTETVLYSFCSLANCADGNNPQSTLVFDAAGNLYGTTRGGAPEGGYGTVFELNPTTGVLTTLYSFTGGADGGSPYAGVIFGKGGDLYGTTEGGGSYGNGSVFAVNPTTQTFTSIFSFPTDSCPPNNCYTYGQFPVSALVKDATGALYGSAPQGGALNWGVVFKLTPGKKGVWTPTVLYNFTAGNDGYSPSGALVFDGAGMLDGVTAYGGAGTYAQGTVFQLNPGTQSLTTLYTFNGIPPQGCPPNCDTFYPNGDQPMGKLSIDMTTGVLYGATQGGGSTTADNCFNDYDSGCGTVFALTP